MTYFPPLPEGLDEPFQCPGCKKWFRRNPEREGVSCAVLHGPGSCCHYSDIEVDPPEPKEEENG